MNNFEHSNFRKSKDKISFVIDYLTSKQDLVNLRYE